VGVVVVADGDGGVGWVGCLCVGGLGAVGGPCAGVSVGLCIRLVGCGWFRGCGMAGIGRGRSVGCWGLCLGRRVAVGIGASGLRRWRVCRR